MAVLLVPHGLAGTLLLEGLAMCDIQECMGWDAVASVWRAVT